MKLQPWIAVAKLHQPWTVGAKLHQLQHLRLLHADVKLHQHLHHADAMLLQNQLWIVDVNLLQNLIHADVLAKAAVDC